MSVNERFLYIIAICILFCGVLFLSFSNDDEYFKSSQAKIRTLDLKVDSLNNTNRELTLKVDSLNKKITIVNSQISLKDSKIKKLKNITNEKVKAVDFFNDDELTKFFTDRYGHYLDSIEKTRSSSSN